MTRIHLASLAALTALAVSAAPAGADGVVIQSAEVNGARIQLRVRNDADHPSGPLSLALTTRAGGFLIGTSVHPLPTLAAGATRELELPLPLWAPERSDLLARIIAEGCCTTQVMLPPKQTELRLSHGPPFPVGLAAPALAKESEKRDSSE